MYENSYAKQNIVHPISWIVFFLSYSSFLTWNNQGYKKMYFSFISENLLYPCYLRAYYTTHSSIAKCFYRKRGEWYWERFPRKGLTQNREGGTGGAERLNRVLR